ncbi:hypothetical protein QNO07_15605 [Streptomyces sp. 549]|uniref:hypothetical protein n=1 Tax=Streptomyces sp. 549 TaxID=3049076 RepID=UPI0024C29F10|nr:hypothetical protein [Streptomyces sp. 549]MDK1474828.1 hypothetical protein [Streptomyces sp. 549]
MQSNDARILRGAAIPTACAGLIGTVVGAFVAGGEGAIGAALGTVLVLAFFCVGLYLLSVIGERWPAMFMGAAVLVYTTQVLIMLILLRIFRDATFMDGRVFGFVMLACILVWLAAQAWSHTRVKTLYVEPESSQADTGTEPRP